jgi:HPt (histidine-containing phosphotransfer) domain-containing protein
VSLPPQSTLAPLVEMGGGIPGLDLEGGLRRVMGNEASYRALLRRFVDGQRDFARSTTSALSEGDWSTAERLAHTVKGVAGNIGAVDVQAEATTLEELVRQRAGHTVIVEQARRTQARIELLAGAVQSLPPPPPPSSSAVDSARLARVCMRLEMLLINGDSEALELLDQNAHLMRAAYPAHFGLIEAAVHDFSFDAALTSLRDALRKSA